MSESSQEDPWIVEFCNMPGHGFFAEVPEEFIEDDFNLTGLQQMVPLYKEALERILDVDPEEEDEEDEVSDGFDEEQDLGEDADGLMMNGEVAIYRRSATHRHIRPIYADQDIEDSAEKLYGLIHQRYIVSRPGIQQMYEKYESNHFGKCPRIRCNEEKVVPIGLSDKYGEAKVKVFCFSCLDVYTPRKCRLLDGCFFGTTFAMLFKMHLNDQELSPDQRSAAKGSNTAPAGLSQFSGGSNANPVVPLQPLVELGFLTTKFADGLKDVSKEDGPCFHDVRPGDSKIQLSKIYEPRIYGFRVSEFSPIGPRMKWLRMKPGNLAELNEVARYPDSGEAEDLTQESEVEDYPPNQVGASVIQRQTRGSKLVEAESGKLRRSIRRKPA